MPRPRAIIDGSRVFIIAEISANHNQVFSTAVRMIKKVKECGADAVKFQCYTPDTITIDVNNRYFRIKHAKWGGQTLYQLYKKAYTPWSWFKRLKKAADDLGLVFFATAFDRSSVDFLEEVGVPVHKIASFELVDIPLIEYAAKTRKPLILSTGMAAFSEIKEAVDAAKRAGARDLTILKCVSAYPALPEEINLMTLLDMKKRFRCKTGLSDHSLGIGVSIAAVSAGVSMIEKHFTISRKIKTPDSFFSIEPNELSQLVLNVRMAEKALGRVYYGTSKHEEKSLIFRRSLFAVCDIKKGERFNGSNVRSIRPAYGLPPRYLSAIIGKKAERKIRRGTPLSWDMVG